MYIYFILFLPFINSFLTTKKWIIIKKIINNDKSPDILKKNIKRLIFNEYYNFSKKQTYLFIENNKKSVKNIKFNELNLYASSGLLKAINNYNFDYNSKFINYAILYIKSDLYKGVTDLTPMRLLPHRYRVNKKWQLNNYELYTKSMKKISSLGDDEWIFDKETNNENYDNSILIDKIDEINKSVSSLEPFLKRIFYYRYNENLNKKFKIKKIAQLMCVSEETIRKSLIIIKKHIDLAFQTPI
jgi:DNA-directed RNA polymerase specialized sigma subunit